MRVHGDITYSHTARAARAIQRTALSKSNHNQVANELNNINLVT